MERNCSTIFFIKFSVGKFVRSIYDFMKNFTGPVIKFYLPYLPRAQTFHSFPRLLASATTTFAHRPRFLSYLIATFLLLTFRKNFSECNYAVHPLTLLSDNIFPQNKGNSFVLQSSGVLHSGGKQIEKPANGMRKSELKMKRSKYTRI